MDKSERLARIKDAWDRGITSRRAISRETGIHPNTVYYDLIKLGLEVPNDMKKNKQEDEAITAALKELIDSGQKLSRPELVAYVKEKTGADRSHGALEHRLGILYAEYLQRKTQEPAQVVDYDTMPGTVKDKAEVVRRQVRRELEAEFEARVVAEVSSRMDYAIKAVERRERDAARVLDGRKGVFTAAQYRMLKACLHPDSRDSVSVERLSEAFRLFNESSILLMDNREYSVGSLPSMEELLKRRRRNAS